MAPFFMAGFKPRPSTLSRDREPNYWLRKNQRMGTRFARRFVLAELKPRPSTFRRDQEFKHLPQDNHRIGRRCAPPLYVGPEGPTP